MKFAKDCLDVGCMTDDPEVVDFFRDEVGLGEPELLRVSSTVDQYRFHLDGSIVKVNLVAGLETEHRSGYQEVALATGAPEVTALTGPDGISVLVGPKTPNLKNIIVVHAVPALSAAQRYYADTLGWEVDGDHIRLGRSAVQLRRGGPDTVDMPVRGWTYLTAQVWDCDAETEAVAHRGATVALSPVTLGTTARISMIADPWGNQLELSQRASLTGPLPNRPEAG